MKITHQCDFNRDGKGLRCPNDATCKWGDNWFCDYHGSRPKSAPPNLDSHDIVRGEVSKFTDALENSIIKHENDFMIYPESEKPLRIRVENAVKRNKDKRRI